jgi:hypothetical protein
MGEEEEVTMDLHLIMDTLNTIMEILDITEVIMAEDLDIITVIIEIYDFYYPSLIVNHI